MSGPRMSGHWSALALTVRRLCDLLDEETLSLRASSALDLKEFNRRKQQGVLELDRALRGLEGQDVPQDVSRLLQVMRHKLEENMEVLGLHLEAIREVSQIMRRCIQRAESDGTYGRWMRTTGSSS